MTNDNFLDALADAIASRIEHLMVQRCRLMDVARASEYLTMTEGAIYTALSRKKMPSVKLDSRVRFDVRDLDKWIESGKENDAT